MTRQEFEPIFIDFLKSRIPTWLAEEDTERGHLDNMQKKMREHNKDIQEILSDNMAWPYCECRRVKERRVDDGEG